MMNAWPTHLAVAVLAKLGYEVSAVTGRSEQADFLKRLGARHIVERAGLSAPGKPLARKQWAGAIDVAFGKALQLGVQPFLLGDALKVALAAGLFPLAWRAVERFTK